MTMPDRIQITYQPKTMAMPDFCALCAELLPVEPPQIFTTMAMQFRSAWREGVEDGWNEARAVLARKGHPPAAAPAPGEKLVTASEDLATDQMMKANLSALLVEECGLHSSGSSTYDLLQRAAAMLVNYGLPARPTYLDAIRLAEGCHDYSGGHSGPEGEAWHGAIDTVVDVLKRAAVGPWDSQTRAVFGIGSEAQAVPVPVAWCKSDEFANSMNRGGSFNGWIDPGAGANKCDMQLYAIPLPAPVPMTECPHCGHEGEMVPAPQAEGGGGVIAAEAFNLITLMADELDRLQPLPACPPITSHPLAIEARALLRGGPTTIPLPQAGDVALAGDRRSAESLQLAHESCRLFGTKNGDCPDSEICWLDLLPCSHYENCATIPASQSGEGEA